MSETKTVTEYEYRVMVRRHGKLFSPAVEPVEDAKLRAWHLRRHGLYESVRIEKRQVIYGPWTAVEEGVKDVR